MKTEIAGETQQVWQQLWRENQSKVSSPSFLFFKTEKDWKVVVFMLFSEGGEANGTDCGKEEKLQKLKVTDIWPFTCICLGSVDVTLASHSQRIVGSIHCRTSTNKQTGRWCDTASAALSEVLPFSAWGIELLTEQLGRVCAVMLFSPYLQ
ncbi:uncharacterized protein rbis isoform X2 [Chiloscyllium plagiosum]|uniref:uncharacterized protein rbis isoform X2 n=1 Tax=Chiloscyllium plagiosum TaxID=36176 RepID=UPI001CB81C9F|nr:uncharacterized protein rbis isoform X2 [Chiloscyllium plagiosum]